MQNVLSHHELITAALPLLEILNNHYNPHAMVIITNDFVKIVETDIAAPLLVKD